jgi:hypothetical protein
MIHQPFICSYPFDYEWLEHCLRSFVKFGDELAPPVVCVASEHAIGVGNVISQARSKASVVVKDGWEGKGMMRAMVAMLSADQLCPSADYIWLFGSDCFLTERLHVADFFQNDRPVMCYTPYEKFRGLYPGGLKWQEGCKRIMGLTPPHEFMRRLPGVYYRKVIERTRAHIVMLHGDFEPFCFSYTGNDFSEANLIGTYAWFHDYDAFSWQQTEFNPTLQFWSHGGLDRPCDGDVMYFGGNARGKTPRQIMNETYLR